MQELEFTAEAELYTADCDGERLDVFLSRVTELSRSRAASLIEAGMVKVGDRVESKKYKLSCGDTVEVTLPEPEPYNAEPEDIPLDIVYEDSDIIVINKPVGMVVHPAPGHYSGTLVNGLLYHCKDSLSGIGGVGRPGIVHRIDRDTSGLIAVAKNDRAHISLSEQLKDHSMHREYRLIAQGGFREDSGVIDAPIGRHPVDRKKMAIVRDGRDARTHWCVLERYSGFTYLEAVLETGRTHQIRVHFSHIGHPLVGDDTYGGGRTTFEKHNAPHLAGQMLHAAALVLTHPVTGEKMRFESPLPEEFSYILDKLRKTER